MRGGDIMKKLLFIPVFIIGLAIVLIGNGNVAEACPEGAHGVCRRNITPTPTTSVTPTITPVVTRQPGPHR
jgi:hypothetical protein